MIKHSHGQIIYGKRGVSFQLNILTNNENYFFEFLNIEQIHKSISEFEIGEYNQKFEKELVEKILTNNSKAEIINLCYQFYENSLRFSNLVNEGIFLRMNPETETYNIVFNIIDNAFSFNIGFENNEIIEINLWVLKFYSKADNYYGAVEYHISRLIDVLNSEHKEYKMIVNDQIIFETYFIIDRNKSKYYGFIDKEDVEYPEYIGEIKTENLLLFLQGYKKLLSYSSELG